METPPTTPRYISAQQAQWFVSVEEGLEESTGRTLAAWVVIARTCPESKQRARLNWLKTEHGLGLNRASLVLNATFESELSWDKPQALLDHVWKTPESRLIYDQVQTIATDFGDDVVINPRKGFSAFTRRFQFAALRPTRSSIRLGLAIPLDPQPKCTKPISSDTWSDRLTSVCLIHTVQDIDEDITALLRRAYQLSA